jgi:hypothetical protein
MKRPSVKKSDKRAARRPKGVKPAVATISPAPATWFAGGATKVFRSRATTALGTVAGGAALMRAHER